MSAAQPVIVPVPGLERVEPQLRELMSLAAGARALPSWSRSIRARQSGQFLSTLRGRGMEYDESRPYQPGDDIRQLDWRVTARTGKPHTKLFREERERPVFLCVDYRRPMFFATRGVFKAVQAARLAALLAWRAQQNGDRVGGFVFADAEHHELPPRRSRTAALQWVKLLAASAPACRGATIGGGDLAPLTAALTRLQRVAKPGSLVFLISDFRGYDDSAAAALARLAQHTDTILLAVHDVLEAEFPGLDGPALVADGRRSLQLAGITASQRADYAAQFERRSAALRDLARAQRLLFSVVTTDADPLAALMRLFGAR